MLTENAEHSATRFSIDAEILYGIYRYAEHTHLEIIAIFHSHPQTDTAEALKPSSIDIKFMKYNPCVWVIAGGLKIGHPFLVAYQLVNENLREIRLRIIE